MPRDPQERLDALLVERGLATSRDAARRVILAGKVRVNDQPADKPGHRFSSDARIAVLEPPEPYVSRGGRKLRHALDHFAINVADAIALDVGASTGGFTDCLLQAGAAKVYAIDVGQNQLHWKLRQDPRVIVREKVNARFLAEEHVPERVDLAVVDVSFISVVKILDPIIARMKPGARLVILAKPQFEVGPAEVGKGGVVRDESLHHRVVEEISQALRERGLTVDDAIESPITGADGNREFLIAVTLPAGT